MCVCVCVCVCVFSLPDPVGELHHEVEHGQEHEEVEEGVAVGHMLLLVIHRAHVPPPLVLVVVSRAVLILSLVLWKAITAEP